MDQAEELAKIFHDLYEKMAPTFDYQTQDASAVPWEDVPANNKQLMIAVCREILQHNRDLFTTAPHDAPPAQDSVEKDK